jgi:hypothetical protein
MTGLGFCTATVLGGAVTGKHGGVFAGEPQGSSRGEHCGELAARFGGVSKAHPVPRSSPAKTSSLCCASGGDQLRARGGRRWDPIAAYT